MPESIAMNIIAHIRSDFPSKFGIPRQSGLADTIASLVFTPPFRNADALRGIEAFSYLWLIWLFSETKRENWSPTVRPPKLNGNQRKGVFATRSPFRPNAIGLSSVRLIGFDLHTSEGPVLYLMGADLMDGTPILDVKPYLPYTDSHPDASNGFACPTGTLTVHCDPELLERLPEERRNGLLQTLAQDPRPGYQHEPERVYGFPFSGFEVRFTVTGNELTVMDISHC